MAHDVPVELRVKAQARAEEMHDVVEGPVHGVCVEVQRVPRVFVDVQRGTKDSLDALAQLRLGADASGEARSEENVARAVGLLGVPFTEVILTDLDPPFFQKSGEVADLIT